MFGCRWPASSGVAGDACICMRVGGVLPTSSGAPPVWRGGSAERDGCTVYYVDVWRKKGGVDDTEVKAGRR